MTKKRSYRRYSPEFKREAIKRACDEGMTGKKGTHLVFRRLELVVSMKIVASPFIYSETLSYPARGRCREFGALYTGKN